MINKNQDIIGTLDKDGIIQENEFEIGIEPWKKGENFLNKTQLEVE